MVISENTHRSAMQDVLWQSLLCKSWCVGSIIWWSKLCCKLLQHSSRTRLSWKFFSENWSLFVTFLMFVKQYFWSRFHSSSRLELVLHSSSSLGMLLWARTYYTQVFERWHSIGQVSSAMPSENAHCSCMLCLACNLFDEVNSFLSFFGHSCFWTRLLVLLFKGVFS